MEQKLFELCLKLKLKLSLFVDFKTQRYSLDKIHDQFNRNYNQINIKNI